MRCLGNQSVGYFEPFGSRNILVFWEVKQLDSQAAIRTMVRVVAYFGTKGQNENSTAMAQQMMIATHTIDRLRRMICPQTNSKKRKYDWGRKAGEFNGRKEGISTSYVSFPNSSLNRSCHACVHTFERIRRRYQRKTYENLLEKLLKFLHNGLTWQEPSGHH